MAAPEEDVSSLSLDERMQHKVRASLRLLGSRGGAVRSPGGQGRNLARDDRPLLRVWLGRQLCPVHTLSNRSCSMLQRQQQREKDATCQAQSERAVERQLCGPGADQERFSFSRDGKCGWKPTSKLRRSLP
jgi:hypothetical protein